MDRINLLTPLQNILIASFSLLWVKISDFGVAGSWAGTSALNTNCGTVAYKAPELLGLLPNHMMTPGQLYNWSIDIWALGAVIHQVLTSQILFLVLEEGAGDSMFSTAPERPVTPQWSTDFALLQEYCADPRVFPLAGLTSHGASPEAIDFVKSLMVPDPKERVSATDALRSVWLVDLVPSLATTVPTVPRPVTSRPRAPHESCQPRPRRIPPLPRAQPISSQTGEEGISPPRRPQGIAGPYNATPTRIHIPSSAGESVPLHPLQLTVGKPRPAVSRSMQWAEPEHPLLSRYKPDGLRSVPAPLQPEHHLTPTRSINLPGGGASLALTTEIGITAVTQIL